jgi:hypothetical protein
MKKITYTPSTKYISNSIIFKSVLLYGHQGIGKTEKVRSFVEKAVKKYGRKNVNARYITRGDYLPYLIKYGLDNKLIQILFCDNATLSRIPRDTLEDYFNIRHIWYNRTKRPYGYILSFLACHRFHGVNTELRTDNDVIIFMNAPTNPFDYSIVKRYIGEEGIARLEYFEKERNRRLNSKYKKYSIFWSRGQIGLYISRLAKENYLKEVSIPILEAYKRIRKK